MNYERVDIAEYEIKNAVIQLLEITQPQFRHPNAGYAPNYEGRTAAFILYVLKLLFGLDGCTEFTLSDLARKINDSQGRTTELRMFDFALWLQFLQYRSLMVRNSHYPASFARQEHENASKCGLFVKFLKQHRSSDDNAINGRFNMTKEVVDKFLKDMEIYEDVNFMDNVGIPHSFTPLSSYLRRSNLNQSTQDRQDSLETRILTDFSSCSLDYILKYKKYLKKLYNDGEYVVIRRGCHDRCIYTDLNHEPRSPDQHDRWTDDFNTNKFNYLFVDTLKTFVLNKKIKPEVEEVSENITKELNVKKVLEVKNNQDKVGRDGKGRFCVKNSEQDANCKNVTRKKRKRGRYFISSWTENPVLQENVRNSLYVHTSGRPLVDVAQQEMSGKRKWDMEGAPMIHHQPHGEYWLLSTPPGEDISRKQWRRMRDLLPNTMRMLLEELGEMCGQSVRDLYQELSLIEMYVSYVHLVHPSSSSNIASLVPTLPAYW